MERTPFHDYKVGLGVKGQANGERGSKVPRRRTIRNIAVACLVFLVYAQWTQLTRLPARSHTRAKSSILSLQRLEEDLTTCVKLHHKPLDPSGPRDRSARYIDGHKPTLIRNATVWTGESVEGATADDVRNGKGHVWIHADILMEFGLIKKVASGISAHELPDGCLIYEAEGRHLTAGIVDMHSHAGVDSLPDLQGNDDTNELSSPITSYVRSLDGLQPLDNQIQVIKSGGVTTSLILPGSGNNIGGEAYVVKFAVGKPDGREEISARDMLADSDRNWRYMKMACGENAKRVYGKIGEHGPTSRLGESWEFRHAFDQARQLIEKQDDWCAAAATRGIDAMDAYLPQVLQLESLTAVLRGQVHVNVHCYTSADLESFVDHTNEFNFSVRAFHHAHETYLVPEVLKRTWGGRPPASALFADNMYYKAESYRGSEQAGKILYENGLTPVYVSDNPVLNAQHVVFEAAKAYRYGLPYHVALAGVTSASAELLGLGERIGKIKAGFDADIVVWDSDPLSIGATPVAIWIDGTAQYDDPVILKKPKSKPIDPSIQVNAHAGEVADYDDVVFTGVSNIMIEAFQSSLTEEESIANVIIEGGKIECVGSCNRHLARASALNTKIVHLTNGHLFPSFTLFGSALGLSEIDAEDSTHDGGNGPDTFARAVDGLALDNKQLAAAYKHGITRAISPPMLVDGEDAGALGISVGFKLAAKNAAEKGAIWNEEVAVHYTLTLAAKSEKTPSISSAVGSLRNRLLSAAEFNVTALNKYTESAYLQQVLSGKTPLAINVDSADTIAALLRVKTEVEETANATIRLIIIGGAESYLLAKDLAAAKVGVVLAPLYQYSQSWDQRRSLTGAPLTNGTAVDVLIDAGVTVAIGVVENWQARDLSLMAGIALANGEGRLSNSDAVGLLGKNVFEMLGLEEEDGRKNFVVFEGNPFDIASAVVAVGGGLGTVSVYES